MFLTIIYIYWNFSKDNIYLILRYIYIYNFEKHAIILFWEICLSVSFYQLHMALFQFSLAEY